MKDGYLVDEPVPGEYLPADSGASLPASKFYLPDDLPPEITLQEKISTIHGRAMHSLGRLDGLWSEIDDPDTVFGLFVYKEAEQSSQVEGTQVTVSDMYRKGADSKDVREARNYAETLRQATTQLTRDGRSRESLSIALLKSLHSSLMESDRTDDDPNPGAFRSQYVWIEEDTNGVGHRVRFVPPKAAVATSKMEDFEQYMQSNGHYPDLVDIAILHYQLETIHPFMDGNGRIGRLLIVLMLIASDILVHPLFYLSSYVRRNRDEYTDRLLAVSEEGEWNAWVAFFLQGIKEQADEAFGRAKLLLQLREEYRTRFRDAPPSVRQLTNVLFTEPVITASRAATLIDMSYPAANSAIDRLEAEGVLRETTGQQRYREFQAEEVLECLNQPVENIPSPGELIATN
jgi:Fic family protein